ncbi:MAG: hypothetical protein GXY41_03580 [Phycisphaerae bacterium]|nr:hypothetical protein [Phycisphaerae bacterium]
MDSQQLTELYNDASALAEAGRYEPAMAKMFKYLRHRPLEGQALNDAATILFCMGRGRDAITCYEKAAQCCQGDQQAQVYWNLCEAYLQENQPARALALFDQLQAMGLLSADLLNRTADTLLRQELLGPAVELLLQSLRMSPEQEILRPMLEVIRSHRVRMTLIVSRRSVLTQSLTEALQQRLSLTVLDDSPHPAAQIPSDTDIALFFGCGPALANASFQTSQTRRVAILDAQDILAPEIKTVNWPAVHTVVFCGGGDLKALFVEQIGTLPTTLRLLNAEPIPNPENSVFIPRKKGKRIAAVGPWDARRNPMFTLMCFQKLHYLDPDTRLHLAGDFADAATERYLRQMIETLDLDNVVFIDGPVQNIQKWLKDKHYIVSTSIDGAGLDAVWSAMAAGLRPIIHTFPGAAERLDGRYLFTLAEDFCDHVLNAPYDAAEHRAAVEQAYSQCGLEQVALNLIFQLESEIPLRNRPHAELPATSAVTPCPPPPTRSIEQIAAAALAATEKLRSLRDHRERGVELSPSASFTTNDDPTRQTDPFEYNHANGLSAEDWIEEDADSVPFSVGG